MNSREILVSLMFDHELERRDVAELVRTDRQTVDSWLAPPESNRHSPVPEMAIELLRFKLAGFTLDAEFDEQPNE